jgi:predicted anti-sigma-YlaC factor YlaD
MAHEDTRIVPFLRGELAESEQRAVESHLAGCAECRATADDFQATLALLAASAPAAPDVHWGGYRVELREKLDARRGTRPAQSRWWRPVSVAFSGALAAVLLFLAVQDGRRDLRVADLGTVEETVIGGKLDLLRQYSLVERLDLLEDLEVIRHLDGLESTRES